MGRDISLFSGYDQKENRTTNYCLLMLRQVYEASPRLLADVLTQLCGEDFGGSVGVRFRQQEKALLSVPDGRISQASFTVYVETKLRDWFHWEQIRDHLVALQAEPAGLKALLALSKFDEDQEERLGDLQTKAHAEFGDSVLFLTASFEEFLDALEKVDLPLYLRASVEELRAYFDQQFLLPTWKTKLEVVNCVTTMHEIEAGGYLCPATGGSYSHARARYFGPYRQKKVDRICEIFGVVDVGEASQEGRVLWNNSSLAISDLVQRADALVNRFRPEQRSEGVRVLVLGEGFETVFRKDSKGGMLGTKRYFEVPDLGARELAAYLYGKDWTTLRESR